MRLSRRGFTLVELVVTLVIIGALAAVSAPLFFSAQDFEENGFRKEILATVRYAQKLAVGTNCGVQVSVASSTVSLTTAAGAGTCFSGPFNQTVLDPSNPGIAFTRARQGITVTSVGVLFCPLGDTSSSGTCTGNYPHTNVTVTVAGQAISIIGATGHVQ